MIAADSANSFAGSSHLIHANTAPQSPETDSHGKSHQLGRFDSTGFPFQTSRFSIPISREPADPGKVRADAPVVRPGVRDSERRGEPGADVLKLRFFTTRRGCEVKWILVRSPRWRVGL